MKKILYVDDERELHDVMAEIFPRDQYLLICAGDGLEGLQKCKNETFDFIIADYRMPKLDGAKFYRQLRDIQESIKSEITPVLFLSGSIEDLKSLNINFEKVEFLEKPFSREDILSKMNEFVKDKIKA